MAKATEVDAILIVDGVCILCNRLVGFLLERDRDCRLAYCHYQSTVGRRLLEQLGRDPSCIDSVVLITRDGRCRERSGAAFGALGLLPGLWRLLGLGRWLPRPLRDGLYDGIARRRYRWFGRRETCILPQVRQEARFIADPDQLPGWAESLARKAER